MNKTELTFLSSRGRGLSNDLALVKDYLVEQSTDEMMFRYYLNNENHKNPLVAHGYRRAKKDFSKGMTNVLCVDSSLSSKINNMAPDGQRILFGVSYDYQFKNMYLLEEKNRKFNLNTFARFTHIIPGSPFTAELLKRAYRMEGKELIENVSLPFAYDLCSLEKQKEIGERIFYYFPQARGKKILSVIVYGDEEMKRKDWESLDVKQWVKELGDDWFLFTNSDLLMENAFSMGNRYKENFGYMNKMLPIPNLLYISDVLVTNNGRLASAFSILDKPVYACRYGKNYFEKYMSWKYPGMYFPTVSAMCSHPFEAEEQTKEQKEFSRNMSYGTDVNPCAKVADILGRKREGAK